MFCTFFLITVQNIIALPMNGKRDNWYASAYIHLCCCDANDRVKNVENLKSKIAPGPFPEKYPAAKSNSSSKEKKKIRNPLQPVLVRGQQQICSVKALKVGWRTLVNKQLNEDQGTQQQQVKDEGLEKFKAGLG
ncbi:hypothetical protein CRENBAI_007725 [Crenichthys baileyi]|uniref:Uncharacterized protein n=1 Tax=Crenichthys baileyi TaxID=28760 RepID=A0AAV9S809_9TELE